MNLLEAHTSGFLEHSQVRTRYVIVDDYYSWAPCRQAVDEFLSEQPGKPHIEPIDWAGAYWRVP